MNVKLGAAALVEAFHSVSDQDEARLNDSMTPGRYPHINVRPKVQIGIVTALEIENVAMSAALHCKRHGWRVEWFDYATEIIAPVNIKLYRYRNNETDVGVALCQTIRMGNNSAAIAATSLMYEFPEVQDILMVGIAGGIPSPLSGASHDAKLIEDHVRLGDIFVSEHPIIQYDFIKREQSRDTNRAVPNSISPRIQRIFQRLRALEIGENFPWERYIDLLTSKIGHEWRRPADRSDSPELFILNPDGTSQRSGAIKHPKNQPRRRKRKPLVHYGKIGSANILLKDPKLRDQLRQDRGIRAVEMEGSGVGDAAWNFGIGYAVIRGISDYCDPDKSNDWQRYAASVAAGYTRSVIDEFIDEKMRVVVQRNSGFARR